MLWFSSYVVWPRVCFISKARLVLPDFFYCYKCIILSGFNTQYIKKWLCCRKKVEVIYLVLIKVLLREVPKPFLVSKILALYVEYNSSRGKGVCNLSKEHERYFNICWGQWKCGFNTTNTININTQNAKKDDSKALKIIYTPYKEIYENCVCSVLH